MSSPIPTLPIAKLATDKSNYLRPMFTFTNARTAFYAFLASLPVVHTDEIWLPAYIGWSAREGSGVFDPIQQVDVKHRFYRVTDTLEIDLDYLFDMLKKSRPKLLVLIHYFGFPDHNLHQIVQWANEEGIGILEDEAHALYSDWVGNVCGRYGMASIFSLHKMLPFSSGGLLMLNGRIEQRQETILEQLIEKLPAELTILNYDLSHIAQTRRANYKKLEQLLEPLKDWIKPLYPFLPNGVVPQTFPVRIYGYSRDQLYFELNEMGYGAVSLYHTLVDSIKQNEFPMSYALAQNIFNLPLHQDVTSEQLEAMVVLLNKLISRERA